MNSSTHHMPSPRFDRTPGRPGFTMLEMLVALVATLMIIGFLNKIFEMTGGAVSRGAGISEVIEQSRVIADCIDRDTANMLGKSGGGFLIIVPGSIAANTVFMSANSTTAIPTAVRVDQIAFARVRGPLEPLCPASDNDVSNSSSAPVVRIWYGHCLKTLPTGADSGTTLGAAGTANQYACSWVLGRQALFLDASPTGVNAATAAGGAAVSGTGGTYLTGYAGAATLQGGIADVCAQTLDGLNTAGITAANAAFGTTDATRLRVNTFSTGGEAWRMAQMHGLLASGVCEFAVDYAMAADTLLTPIKWNPATGNPGPFTKAPGQVWPALLRIRYRLNDKRGLVYGLDGAGGAMFEKIIRVPG